MTQTNVNVQMQIRRDTAANWQSNNTLLLDGEWGYVKDTNIFKIGNGSTQFNFLPEAVLSSNGSYSSPLFISNYHLKITSQKELRFSDDVDGATGEHYSSFKAGSQSANINYTLPTTAPTDNQYLKCSAAGVLSWDTFTGTDIADLVSNDANNRILTATGTTNSFNAEANLTYDGSRLEITTDAHTEGLKIVSAGDTYNDFVIGANRTGAGTHLGRIIGQWNGGNVAIIAFNTGTDTNSKDDGFIDFQTSNGGSNPSSRMTIQQDGQVGIGTQSPIARLHVKNSTGHIGYFESTQAAANVDNIVLNSSQTNSSSNLVFQINGGTTAQGIIRLNGDNSLDFYNGATPTFKARLNSSGHLGLNVTSPSGVLHAYQATGTQRSFFESGDNHSFLRVLAGTSGKNSGLEFYSASSNIANITALSSTALQFDVGSVNGAMFINSAGHVGINCTPSRHLHVHSGTSDIVAIFESGDTAAQIQIKDANGTCAIECLNDFRFANSAGEIFRLQSDKDVNILDGDLILASGHGINFHNYATSGNPNSNLLNDYEEGYWDPEIYDGMDNGSGGVATLSVQHGRYTKVGNCVTLTFFVQLNAASSTAQALQISGLPFTISTPSENSQGFGLTNYHNLSSLNVGNVILAIYGIQNADRFAFYVGSSSVTSPNNTNHNGEYIIGGLTYFTES